MKKLISGLVLGLAVLAMGSSAEAASAARGGKGYLANNYATTISTVSAKTATLYSVVIGTSVAGVDYVALFDLASGVTIPGATSNLSKMRLFASSTTQNTVFNFDPPIVFANGIQAVNSAATFTSAIVYEQGRNTGGQ